MTKIAVTGASGHLGTLVVKALIPRVGAENVIAIVRDSARATELTNLGVDVREGDYDAPATIEAALQGADRVLLISGVAPNRAEQHRNVIQAAKTAGVQRIAYTSVLAADTTSNPVAPDHVATEQAILESGLEYAILRNGWYNENYLQNIDSASAGGVLVTNAANGTVASAARADYAEAAAVVLAAETVEPIYELAGDVAWSYQDLADALSEVTGTQIRLVPVSAEEHTQLLIDAGVPEWAVPFTVGVEESIAKGELGLHTGTISALTGKPTTPLIETLRAAR